MLGRIKRTGLGIFLGVLLFALPSQAGWRYELQGPGNAVWINEETQERIDVLPGTPAPDQTPAPGTENGSAEGVAVQGQNGEATDTVALISQEVGPGIPEQEVVPEETVQEEQIVEESQENSALRMSRGRQLDVTRPMVALTYDDGPYPAVGNIIMDELAKVGGRATFFVVGNRVAGNQAELQRMIQEGHEIGNHSWDHQYFNKLGAAEIQNQVARANEAIMAACGTAPVLIRLPGGNITDTVRKNVNMPMIYWSIDTLDWKTKNAQKTIDTVLSQIQDGDIVLMHEIWRQTGTASQTLIPELVRRGYQLVTVSELAEFKGYSLGLGVQYSSFR